jgi:hypothetical protein
VFLSDSPRSSGSGSPRRSHARRKLDAKLATAAWSRLFTVPSGIDSDSEICA